MKLLTSQDFLRDSNNSCKDSLVHTYYIGSTRFLVGARALIAAAAEFGHSHFEEHRCRMKKK